MNDLFGRLVSVLNFVASLLILALMALITTDVIGRALFGQPLYGVPELTAMSVVCIVWLQMAYTLRARHHLRSDLLLAVMPRSGQRAILVLNALVGLALFALIAYTAAPELARAWRTGAFEGEWPIRVPTWPIWGIVVLGSGLTAIEYMVQTIGILSGRDTQEMSDRASPVAGG